MNFFKKTIKSLFIFLAVFGLVFSNLPYEALTGVLKSYISSRNIVDKIWVASSDSNVVDKFVPFENVIRDLKIKDALAVANGDGKIFYSISANTTPRTRDYISSTNTFNTAASTVVGATALQVVTKASPTKDEMIAGYVNSAGTLQVMCWNGTAWTNEWSVAAGGTDTTRRFDIAYETSSGDAMVLYSTNVGTTNELAYRTKLGSAACGSANWSAGTNLDPVRTTGIVHWVKLAHDRRAAQNLITAIWADANADLSAMVWSGSAWGNEPTAALETALEIVTAGQDVESFDVEYESLSGDVMIVRGSGGTATTNGAFYSVCTGGTSTCTWGARTAMPTVLDDATHLDIAGDPNSDKILYGAIGNAGADLNRGVWSGTAWTNSAGDAACATPLAGTKFVAVGWLNNGATNRGVLVYYDSAATNIGWNTVSGTTWTAQTDAAVTPVFGVQKNYDIKVDPINKDRLMFTVNDAVSDISAKRLIMDAAGAFTWSDSTGGAPIEANTGSATYKSFNFEYNRYIPVTNTTTIADGTDPGNSTIAPSAAITDLDAFTLATNSGTDSVTALTVTLTGANSFESLSEVRITNDAGGTLYFSAVANPSSNTINFSGGTPIPVSTSATQFKVRITPKTHANMPVPAGLSYAVGGTVTAFTSTNGQAGTDATTPATITVDNLSPNGATAVSGAAGNAANTINWTTSNSADFNTTNGSVILRWASGTAGAEVPAEGNSTYTAGNTITTATVACVISSAASTAQSKIDGTGGSAGCTATALTNGQAYTYKAFQRDTNGNYDVGVLIGTFTPSAPAAVLTVSTFGSQTANLDSGVSNTHLGGALTFSINTGTASVTGIKVSNNGTAGNLSDIRLYYDTDGTYSGGESCFNTVCTDGGGGTLGTSIAGTLAMTSGNTYYIYVIADIATTVAGGLTADLQITNPSTDITTDATNTDTVAKNITGSTTVRPNVTDVTNSPLADGGRNGETFTITGAGFGTLCASVSVQVEGTALTCNSANNTTISATIPSTQITTYGGAGASGLLATVGGTADDARQTYYVYPSVNLVSTPLVANAAREAENITLTNSTANASRFGATQGTVTFSGGFGSVSGSVVSWGDTSIEVTVPAGIGDNVYLGDITVTRNADAKTDLAYDSNGFRVLPKITSTSPLNLKGGQGDTGVSIAGDHLCQSGTCPSAFSATNKVSFTGGEVTSGASTWTHTSIPSITIPGTAIDGNLTITSNTSYTSNALTYDVKFAPSTPTGSSAGGSNPTLSGTAFSDGTDGDTHLKAQWQIAHNADGDWTTPEWSRTSGSAEVGTTVNTTNGTFANSDAGQTELDCGTTYKGRARYMDNANGGADAYAWEWSSWSANYTFSTAACNVAPTLTVSQPDGIGDTVNVGDLYNITYDLADPDNIVTAAMYYDVDAVGLNGTAITGACATAAEGTGATCSWNTTGMTVGTYYVYGITNDGVNPAVNDYSPGIITINAPPQVTADASGTQTTPMDSGATGQYIGAVFRFQQSSGSADTITALTISETGTVNANANLSTNAGIRYETGVATCTYNGTETLVAGTFNVSEKMALSSLTIPVTVGANYTCVYVVFDVASGAVGGQTIELEITAASDFTLQNSTAKAGTYPVALSGSTTVRPNVTDVTDSPLADGGRNGETFTITGAGFGTLCASVSVQVEGTTLTCNSANNTTISATIPSTQTTTYGGAGASGMLVTIGGTADDARQTYYVYPSVNLVSTPSVANAAREAENITLTNSTANASRFGATQGTVTFSGGFGSVSGSIVSWGDTSIEVTVPAGIGDNVYLGDITVTRNADSKTDLAYGSNGFRVLPKITGFTPGNGEVGAAVQVDGNHFCQNGGTCPSSFSADNKVTFTSAVDATVFTSWTATAMNTQVPASAVTGNVVLRSNGYDSNGSSFSVDVPTPAIPTTLKQSRNAGFTNLIGVGEIASSTPVYFSGDTSSTVTGGTMYLQVEMRPTTGGASTFTDTCTSNPYCFEGTGSAYSGGTITVTAATTSADDLYHWQTRARYNKSSADYFSTWQCYPSSGCNSENATDLKVDTTAPVISNIIETPSMNGGTIAWTTNELATTQLEYGTDLGLVGSTLTAITDTPAETNGKTTGHSVSISNLTCATMYYYRARSRDSGNIEGTTGILDFTTSACPSQPAKTAVFHIVGSETSITSGSPLNETFNTTMPETATTTKSALIEISGIYTSGASSKDVVVQINSETARTYTLPASSTSHFTITHPVTTVNASNTLTVTPQTNTTIYITSAKLIVTYAYTP